MKLIEATSITLEEYISISSGTLKIPYTQRPYEWGKDQAKKLFNDLYSVHTNPSTKHVLNFITVYEEDGTKYIYDGQQRSVSVLLIICSLIKILRDTGYEKLANDFINTFVYKNNVFTDEKEYKLEFEKSTTNDVFRNYISEAKNIPDNINLSDYEKKLKTNFELFQGLFEEKLGGNPSPEIIREIMKNIVQNVMLILIETTDEDIATKMFDTLNSTGLQLADFYVLKNSLVRTLDEDTVKLKWDTIESNTDGLNKKKFLFNFVNSYNGKTADNKLYDKIEEQKKLDQYTNAEKLLQELETSSYTFLTLDSPRQRTDGTEAEQLNFVDLVNTLKITKATQYKPIVFSMDLQKYPQGEINKVLEAIIKLHLRNIFVGQEPSNTLEQFYPTIAKQIYDRELVKVEQILEKINNKMLDNKILKDRFKVKLIKTRNDEVMFRYILREIYNKQNKELKINPDTMKITLEHILPRTPDFNSQWLIDFDEEIRDQYTYLMGNITIILGSINSAAKNKDFNTKAEEYKKSQIPQNNQIGSLERWTTEEIDRRTLEIYEHFITIWNKF